MASTSDQKLEAAGLKEATTDHLIHSEEASTDFPPLETSVSTSSQDGFSAENPPPLLQLNSEPSRPALTREERELVKPGLQASLMRSPYYAQRIEKEGDAFLEAWISGMACNRGLLNLPLSYPTPTSDKPICDS